MNEHNIQQSIRLALSQTGARIFRQNVAQAWTGDATKIHQGRMMFVEAGSVVIKNARPLHAGLCKGSSDLIGWTPLTITPDMVGKKIAVFTAVEVKTRTGKITTEQQNFIDRVRLDGGIAGVARSTDDAIQITQPYEQN